MKVRAALGCIFGKYIGSTLTDEKSRYALRWRMDGCKVGKRDGYEVGAARLGLIRAKMFGAEVATVTDGYEVG